VDLIKTNKAVIWIKDMGGSNPGSVSGVLSGLQPIISLEESV